MLENENQVLQDKCSQLDNSVKRLEEHQNSILELSKKL